MAKEIAIKVDHVAKTFHEQAGSKSLKAAFVNFGRKVVGKKEKRIHRGDFTALKDISFEVKKGEFFGIVGRNGSGKSTLLKIIAGVYTPTKGGVHVNGRLTPFIELGVGFNPELSGRDNVFLNGALLGFTRKQMEEMYDDIVRFAELEEFMDIKLKNYSSGMQVRLAFSVAIRADSEILLIDEVLAVGDAAFQRKCFEIFKDIKNSNRTVIFVSHDMGAVREYCDRVILVENGEILAQGAPDKIANDYIQLFNPEAIKAKVESENRWGDFRLTLEKPKVTVKKDTIDITFIAEAKETIKKPILGMIIKNLDNAHILDTNTKWKKIDIEIFPKGSKHKILWSVPNVFKNGRYKLTIAAAHEDGLAFYDWREEVSSFDITRDEITAGLVVLEDTAFISKIK